MTDVEAVTDGVVAGPVGPSSGTTSAARLKAARELRRLGNALVSHQVDDAVLEEITARLGTLTPLVEAAPERTHAFLASGADFFASRPKGHRAEADEGFFPDCIVSGLANPMGMEARLQMDGDEAVMEVTLGAAFEGAPGRAHGGVVAALIDETMGLVLSITETLAFTGKLAVSYRAPTPLGLPITARARLSHQSGRRLTITAELRSHDTLLAEAEGLFIAVDPAHFLSQG
ncbi:MAG TPA: PaaI family thioesterase [Acidimicrobiales bacterium]|nr:PaaI family thioesterase [Acidimicrobiales bacterium]